MSGSISLGRLAGIPVNLHYTWFIIFALVTVSLSLGVFPQQYPEWSAALKWGVGGITSVFFFASVVAHELTHSLVSRSFGVPVKSITLFIFGGVARISRESTRAREEFLMALAGPLSSLALAGFFWVAALLLAPVSQPAYAGTRYLSWINLLLAAFNLVPAFPLDGGRVFRSILWGTTGNYQRSTRWAAYLGQGFAYLLILGGIAQVIFLGNLGGLWFALIGWFLENAASSSYRQTLLRESLKGVTAAQVMAAECPIVPPSISVQELVDGYVIPTGRRCFMVTREDRLQGMMTLHDVKGVPRPQWSNTSVSQAMLPLEKLQTARPQDEVVDLLERMDEQDVNQIPIVENGKLLGVVARDSILRFIRINSELRS